MLFIHSEMSHSWIAFEFCHTEKIRFPKISEFFKMFRPLIIGNMMMENGI
jgi:hypothetical protein